MTYKVLTSDANQPAQTIANALFKIELIRCNWPVPFDVVDLDGKPVSLEEYKGKVLLIDFWAMLDDLRGPNLARTIEKAL